MSFLVMPYRLNIAPATFQSLMNEIYKTYLRRLILVNFFDDIHVYNKSKYLFIVLSNIGSTPIICKCCEFENESIAYLGHIVSINGVVVDLERVDAIMSWLMPTKSES